MLAPGDVIDGRFAIERHAGAGGVGAVYRARDLANDRAVAIKVVRPSAPTVAERFEREARALAELAHPSIVAYVAHGRLDHGALYLAMEWLEGEDLATRLAVSRLSPEEAIALGVQAANALAFAHGRGIVHRDLKPANLFLVEWRADRVKLLDFGVARIAELSPLTETGAMIGTPLYMAPEQLRGAAIDSRADVFALGAVLFHALTGRTPFPASCLGELVSNLLDSRPAPRLSTLEPALPAELDALVARMLDKDPAARPPGAAAVRDALRALDRREDATVATAVPVSDAASVSPASIRVDEPLARGAAALTDGRWTAARAAFEEAIARGESAQARIGLGDALWWLGDYTAAVAEHARGYMLLHRANDTQSAALLAVKLAVIHKHTLGNRVACTGWLARAARLLGDEPGPAHGYLWLAQCIAAADPQCAIEHAERALAAGRAHGDRDLELCAMSELGYAKVGAGAIDDGMALIDEAVAAALGGESERLDTVVTTTCCMVSACDHTADVERLLEWCRAADRFMERYGCPFLFGDCRVHYGSALLATGRWSDAERELVAVLRVAATNADFHVLCTARLAELRVRQGRLEEARAVLAPIEDRHHARPVLAAIEYARGRYAAAAGLLHRFLDGCASNALEAAPALDLLVATSLAAGDRDGASAAARQLADVAARHGSRRIAAHAGRAAARVVLSTEGFVEARPLLERAIDLLVEARLPHEAAQLRLELATALAGNARELARTEAEVAATAFDRLGATLDADAAAALLRTLSDRDS